MIKQTVTQLALDRNTDSTDEPADHRHSTFASGGRMTRDSEMIMKLQKIQKHAMRARKTLFGFTVLMICILIIVAITDNLASEELISYEGLWPCCLIGAFFFTIAGALCLTSLFLLMYTVGKNFKDELKRERQNILICSTVFAASFFLQVMMTDIFYVVLQVEFEVELAFYFSIFPLELIVYNIIPYSTLMVMHWRNFRPKPEQEVQR